MQSPLKLHPLFHLTILLLLTKSPLQAADYYLSANGHDEATGTSARTPWRSLERLRQVTLRPGDRIRLRGGDTFAGNFHLENIQGDSRRSLTISSYGRGAGRYQRRSG